MSRVVTDLIVDALACYRLTRLVTRDTITAPARVCAGTNAHRECREDRGAVTRVREET